jgi:hypothetical protein
MSHSMLSDRSPTRNLSLEKMAVETGGKQKRDVAGAALSDRLRHLVATDQIKNKADEEEHRREEAGVVASPSARRTTNKAATKSKWQGLQLVLQKNNSNNLSVLRQDIAQLREISLDCRHENEELLEDTHALFDENAGLSEEVQGLKQDRGRLQQENRTLTEKLESALLILEETGQLPITSTQQQQGSIASSFAGVVGLCRGVKSTRQSSLEDDSAICAPADTQSSVSARGAASNESEELHQLQVQNLKAELKRERRRWDTEQRAMNEQYKKDQVEKDALRDVAQGSFVKLKQVRRENKKMKKEIQRLTRFAVAATEAVPETAAAPEQKQSQCRWRFMPGALRKHEGVPSSSSCEQPHMGRQCDREEEPSTGSAMELVSVKEDGDKGSSSDPQDVVDDDQSLSRLSVEKSLDEFDTDLDAKDSQEFHESVSHRMMELSMYLPLHDSEDQAGHGACTLPPPTRGSLYEESSELEEEEEEPCLTSTLQRVNGGVCGPVGTVISATLADDRPRCNTRGRWSLPCMLPGIKNRNKGGGQGKEEDEHTQATNVSRLSRAINLPAAASVATSASKVRSMSPHHHNKRFHRPWVSCPEI